MVMPMYSNTCPWSNCMLCLMLVGRGRGRVHSLKLYNSHNIISRQCNLLLCVVTIFADVTQNHGMWWQSKEHAVSKQSRSTKPMAKNNEEPANHSLFWQLLLLRSSCEFNFFTESLHKLFKLDFTPFSTVAHCDMTCFLGIWDNGSVYPHVPSGHIYSILDIHLIRKKYVEQVIIEYPPEGIFFQTKTMIESLF